MINHFSGKYNRLLPAVIIIFALQGAFFNLIPFYVGVLQEYNVPTWMHWIIMRMNGMNSVREYKDTDVLLQIPYREVVVKLMKLHRISQ